MCYPCRDAPEQTKRRYGACSAKKGHFCTMNAPAKHSPKDTGLKLSAQAILDTIRPEEKGGPHVDLRHTFDAVVKSELVAMTMEMRHQQAARKRGENYAGRPTKYTKRMAELICHHVAEGQSLRTLCAIDPTMPCRATIHRWLSANREFRDQYARAQIRRADALADMVLEAAFDPKEDVQRARLKVDALKWVAGKLAPKKYGHAALSAEAGEPIDRLGELVRRIRAGEIGGEDTTPKAIQVAAPQKSAQLTAPQVAISPLGQ